MGTGQGIAVGIDGTAIANREGNRVMACRYLRFEAPYSPAEEWVPMSLREATCTLRRSDPRRWTAELRCLGVEVEDETPTCLHNLRGTWDECPLGSGSRARRAARDSSRNEFGYPLQI